MPYLEMPSREHTESPCCENPAIPLLQVVQVSIAVPNTTDHVLPS
jgi:hypothetical protein